MAIFATGQWAVKHVTKALVEGMHGRSKSTTPYHCYTAVQRACVRACVCVTCRNFHYGVVSPKGFMMEFEIAVGNGEL